MNQKHTDRWHQGDGQFHVPGFRNRGDISNCLLIFNTIENDHFIIRFVLYNVKKSSVCWTFLTGLSALEISGVLLDAATGRTYLISSSS